MPNDLLNTDEMSHYLFATYGFTITPAALAWRRSRGADGPEFIRVGRAVLYRRRAGDDYASRAMTGPLRSTRQSATSTALESVAA